MRPEGCQETVRTHPGASRFPATYRFQTVSRLSFLDASLQRDLYSSYDQSTRVFRRAGLRRLRARVARRARRPGDPACDVRQRRQRRRRAGPRPRTGRLRGPRRQRAREVLRVVPADDPMQIAVLVDTSQAARDDISHMRTALPPFIAALTGGEGKNQVAIIAIGERPTVFADYSTSAAALKKGDRSHLGGARQRRLPARRRSSKSARGSRSAKPPARSSSRSRPKGPN